MCDSYRGVTLKSDIQKFNLNVLSSATNGRHAMYLCLQFMTGGDF